MTEYRPSVYASFTLPFLTLAQFGQSALPQERITMLTLNTPLKKSAKSTPVMQFIQPTSLLRFTLLFLMLATPVLLSLLPNQGEANYFLSAKVGDHSYGLPAYCQSITATLTQCTPIGTLPLSNETSSGFVKGTATAFQGSRERLECHAEPNALFECRNSLTQVLSME